MQLSDPPPADKGEAPDDYLEAPPPVSMATTGRYQMPDVFTVQVVVGRETKEILVRVERAKGKKPFLGGYRHRETGVEYHHASAQTLPKRRPDSEVWGEFPMM